MRGALLTRIERVQRVVREWYKSGTKVVQQVVQERSKRGTREVNLQRVVQERNQGGAILITETPASNSNASKKCIYH